MKDKNKGKNYFLPHGTHLAVRRHLKVSQNTQRESLRDGILSESKTFHTGNLQQSPR